MAGTRCRGCGAKIEFRTGPKGRSIPVQRVRTLYAGRPNGLVKLDAGGLLSNEDQGIWVSHFELCPKAGQFSRGAKP